MTTEAATANTGLEQEQEALKSAMESGRWESLTAEAFPLFSKEQPKPFYLAKFGMINTEIQSLTEAQAIPLMDEGSRGTLRGRLKELGAAASETIKLLYPNVKPASQESSPVTPETIKDIEEFVQDGAIEQLNENDVPGWDSLAPDQKLLYRLGALLTYYSEWHEKADDDTFRESQTMGFSNQPESLLHQVKRVTEIAQQKIIERHLPEWLAEAKKLGLEDNPVVKEAQSLIEPSSKTS